MAFKYNNQSMPMHVLWVLFVCAWYPVSVLFPRLVPGVLLAWAAYTLLKFVLALRARQPVFTSGGGAVVITGTSSGIGAALSQYFAKKRVLVFAYVPRRPRFRSHHG